MIVLLLTLGNINSIISYFSTPAPTASPAPTKSPTPQPFPYKIPIIPTDRAYVTLLVGDSIVEALGPNANELRTSLIKRYPANEFVNYNYGYGATNILSLNERLHEPTDNNGASLPSILSQRFDLIIFESFAYNPLSEYEVTEGTKIHIAELKKAVLTLIETHPDSAIAIMTPIAPSREHFAKNTYDLSDEIRAKWVGERIAYIDAVKHFANQNNIPLIDVYEKSLLENGEVDLKYVNPTDFIHPSKAGVSLISETIADFIHLNEIFPY